MKPFTDLPIFLSMKHLLTIALVTIFLLGCSKDEETGIKTASHVRIHEITTQSSGSSVTFWYIFYKDGKFIYTKSATPLDEFAGVFFTSSKKVPNDLKFTEEYIKSTSWDTWGLRQIDTTLVIQDTLVDSVSMVDSVQKVDPFLSGDSVAMLNELDSMPGESRRRNLPKVFQDSYEILEP